MKKYIAAIVFAVGMLHALGGTASAQQTVAVIGTGEMGSALGPRLAGLGYQVVYGSRTPDSDHVLALLEETGNNALATTPGKAAQQGDIVFLLVPWPPMEAVARSLGNLDGKIVVDVSMPFEQGADGYPQHLLPTSSAEMIQDWNPGASVVKAFATMGAYVVRDPKAAGGRVSIPIAADDRKAKETIASVAVALGLDPVDFGPLRMARHIEIMQMIYMIPLSQNRPEAWEFYFRRSDHFGCYLADGETSEGLDPVVDWNDLAAFPGNDDSLSSCSE